MSNARVVYPCLCGELLYAERIEGEWCVVIRHGENPDHTRVFADDDRDVESKMADWYIEMHERIQLGLHEKGNG